MSISKSLLYHFLITENNDNSIIHNEVFDTDLVNVRH